MHGKTPAPAIEAMAAFERLTPAGANITIKKVFG